MSRYSLGPSTSFCTGSSGFEAARPPDSSVLLDAPCQAAHSTRTSRGRRPAAGSRAAVVLVAAGSRPAAWPRRRSPRASGSAGGASRCPSCSAARCRQTPLRPRHPRQVAGLWSDAGWNQAAEVSLVLRPRTHRSRGTSGGRCRGRRRRVVEGPYRQTAPRIDLCRRLVLTSRRRQRLISRSVAGAGRTLRAL